MRPRDLEVAVPRMPVIPKADALRIMRSSRMTFARYQTSGVRIRVYDDAAVVTGRLQRTRVVATREVDDWRFTKMYVKGQGAWLVVAFQAWKPPALRGCMPRGLVDYDVAAARPRWNVSSSYSRVSVTAIRRPSAASGVHCVRRAGRVARTA
jgi:Domain of unknown function (DUF4440)